MTLLSLLSFKYPHNVASTEVSLRTEYHSLEHSYGMLKSNDKSLSIKINIDFLLLCGG